MRTLFPALAATILLGCAAAPSQDTEAWIGQPVSVLDKHPLFLTMQVVKTQASDGTDIRNYVNGRDISSCNQDGMVFGRRVGWGMYTGFTSCISRFEACNNIFYIRDERVQRVVVVPSGGARCPADPRFQPSYAG